MLYNLGVGASTKTEHGLELLYEGSENFAALTSFGVVPAFGGLTGLVSGKVPGLDIDLSKVSMRKDFNRWGLDIFVAYILLTSSNNQISEFRIPNILFTCLIKQ